MDISEKGLETLIVKYLTDNNGYEQLTTTAYNKEMALVEEWLVTFIKKTQHKKVTDSMCFASPSEKQKFLTRLRDEITKRGVTDVLRKGYKFNGQTFDLYYPLPSKLNKSAKLAYEKNVFGVIDSRCRRKGAKCAVPRIYHEAGYRRGVHSRCASILHTLYILL